ncbi:class I SAM-dependent methyltransferase [bacterium]|nr:class I SAM-dependent methyltransferase [bacterium]
MNREEYQIMYEAEDTFWWYVGRREIILSFLNKAVTDRGKDIKILDAGCGTGKILQSLKDYGFSVGIDISREAIQFCKIRGLENISQASVMNLPFRDGAFDLIVSLDVLYHSWVKDDCSTMKEFGRILKEDGMVLITLPAYNFLKSPHDKAAHTKHRYTRREVKKKMEEASFLVERATYFNTILFPLICVVRLWGKIFISNKKVKSDIKPINPIINMILTFVLWIELKIIQQIDLPFGLSVLCMGKKSI